MKRLWMINRKSIWKPGIGMPGDPTRGLTVLHMNPPSQRADVRWVMASERKTPSFMENGDQQKCLDKALYTK